MGRESSSFSNSPGGPGSARAFLLSFSQPLRKSSRSSQAGVWLPRTGTVIENSSPPKKLKSLHKTVDNLYRTDPSTRPGWLSGPRASLFAHLANPVTTLPFVIVSTPPPGPSRGCCFFLGRLLDVEDNQFVFALKSLFDRCSSVFQSLKPFSDCDRLVQNQIPTSASVFMWPSFCQSPKEPRHPVIRFLTRPCFQPSDEKVSRLVPDSDRPEIERFLVP
jgi:hypothetical protein